MPELQLLVQQPIKYTNVLMHIKTQNLQPMPINITFKKSIMPNMS